MSCLLLREWPWQMLYGIFRTPERRHSICSKLTGEYKTLIFFITFFIFLFTSLYIYIELQNHLWTPKKSHRLHLLLLLFLLLLFIIISSSSLSSFASSSSSSSSGIKVHYNRFVRCAFSARLIQVRTSATKTSSCTIKPLVYSCIILINFHMSVLKHILIKELGK